MIILNIYFVLWDHCLNIQNEMLYIYICIKNILECLIVFIEKDITYFASINVVTLIF